LTPLAIAIKGELLQKVPTVLIRFVLSIFFASIVPLALAQSTYHLAQQFPIGGTGGWDYITVDSAAKRIYVSHGKQVEVLDEETGKSFGVIADTPGVHGIAFASELKRGFTSNGGDGSVTVFDTQTLATIKKVKANDPDFILYDPFSKRVFPMNGTITVLDAQTGEKAGEVDLGGDPESAVSDGKGTLYVNLADKGAVAVVDVQALKVTKTYLVDDCVSPHSLAYDAASQRLFIGCRNSTLAVVDAITGKVVAHQQTCSGVDAGGFDPGNKLIFISCSEGVISVIHELAPDYYELVDTVKTQLWARTMALDPITKKIYLPTADIETVATSDPKKPFVRKMKPGSFRVLVVSP
jgi:DNA-binding beta-propeller fold protein YncE